MKITFVVMLALAAMWIVISETDCSDEKPIYVGGIMVAGCR